MGRQPRPRGCHVSSALLLLFGSVCSATCKKRMHTFRVPTTTTCACTTHLQHSTPPPFCGFVSFVCRNLCVLLPLSIFTPGARLSTVRPTAVLPRVKPAAASAAPVPALNLGTRPGAVEGTPGAASSRPSTVAGTGPSAPTTRGLSLTGDTGASWAVRPGRRVRDVELTD